VHFDPEFETYTYGDPTQKRKSLLKLRKGDLLVFYAGLEQWPSGHSSALYLIGYFTVEKVYDFDKLESREKCEARQRCKENAHLKRFCPSSFDKLVIVCGQPSKSHLLKRAVQLSNNSNGYISNEMKKKLGVSRKSFTRSVPQWVCKKEAIEYLRKLLRENS
jgi:hypothetical protein